MADRALSEELQAMQAIVDTMEPLDPEAQRRVVWWAVSRYHPAMIDTLLEKAK